MTLECGPSKKFPTLDALSGKCKPGDRILLEAGVRIASTGGGFVYQSGIIIDSGPGPKPTIVCTKPGASAFNFPKGVKSTQLNNINIDTFNDCPGIVCAGDKCTIKNVEQIGKGWLAQFAGSTDCRMENFRALSCHGEYGIFGGAETNDGKTMGPKNLTLVAGWIAAWADPKWLKNFSELLLLSPADLDKRAAGVNVPVRFGQRRPTENIAKDVADKETPADPSCLHGIRLHRHLGCTIENVHVENKNPNGFTSGTFKEWGNLTLRRDSFKGAGFGLGPLNGQRFLDNPDWKTWALTTVIIEDTDIDTSNFLDIESGTSGVIMRRGSIKAKQVAVNVRGQDSFTPHAIPKDIIFSGVHIDAPQLYAGVAGAAKFQDQSVWNGKVCDGK